MNKFIILKETKKPKILVVTPLLPSDKISKETKKTIKRNNTKFTWISSIGNNNIPTNVELGLKWFLKRDKVDYILPLDNDIILGRYMIDRLLYKLESYRKKSNLYAYSFASFKFKGYMNVEFINNNFDINKLLNNNYISSNSLIHIDSLKKIGWFVKDNKYKRLLDWALWLKFLKNGFTGVPCPEANFIALSNKNDISSKSNEDYILKKQRIIKDFVNPFIIQNKKLIKERYSYKN